MSAETKIAPEAALEAFAKHFAGKMVETPPDFQKAIDEHFWELL